jgi:hypothetical protein
METVLALIQLFAMAAGVYSLFAGLWYMAHDQYDRATCHFVIAVLIGQAVGR